MERLNCRSIEEYLHVLAASRAEEERLLTWLRITISRFFRDRMVWSSLAETVFPILHRGTDRLKIWSAGCSCGEEPYSILLLHRMQFAGRCSVDILATDANDKCLERARQGRYPAGSLRELDPQIVSTCFHRLAGQGDYEILPPYRESITWRQHDFFSEPPDRGFHLIFLRNNLLTYHSPQVQQNVLGNILQSMLPGGYLVIGCHETLPELPMNLTPLKDCGMIYQLQVR